MSLSEVNTHQLRAQFRRLLGNGLQQAGNAAAALCRGGVVVLHAREIIETLAAMALADTRGDALGELLALRFG
jgi:hypothetical protein